MKYKVHTTKIVIFQYLKNKTFSINQKLYKNLQILKNISPNSSGFIASSSSEYNHFHPTKTKSRLGILNCPLAKPQLNLERDN